MRTTTLLALSLSTAATLVTADKAEGGGALQALLERMQTKKHQNEARALGHAAVRPPPADYKSGTDAHNSTSFASSEARSTRLSQTDSKKNKVDAKTAETKKKVDAKHKIEAKTADAKARLRSTEPVRRAAAPPSISPSDGKSDVRAATKLERELRIAESHRPAVDDEFDSLSEAEKNTATAPKSKATTDSRPKHAQDKAAKPFGRKVDLATAAAKKEEKRWVWGTAIIQDDTPASAAPSIGDNVNLLTPGTTIAANTPTATLAAPSFPPVQVAAQSSSQTPAPSQNARQSFQNRKKNPAIAPARDPTAKQKRWTWGSSIIQDGDENAPPVGENANLLSSGTTIAMTTPAAALTPPSFPPLADATSSSTAAVETASSASSEAVQMAQVVDSASSTLSAAAADVTTTTAIQALLSELQDQINALAQVYGTVDAASASVAAADATLPAENAKRWVWGPSIIQDDTPASAAPSIGQNVNLLNSDVPVNTPEATLAPPSFPPLAAATPSSSSPVGGAAKLAAAAPSVAPPSDAATPSPSPDVVTSSSSSSSSSAVHRNRKSEADSIRSARHAAAQTAALEWHLAQTQKRGMARHQRKM
ncbi:hypothetical protein JCM10212_005864 [Sporobolomyces blumeae]